MPVALTESVTADVVKAAGGQARSADEVARDDEHDLQEREETLSVANTSLAAVATAWSAFQAATWSGKQTFALSRMTKLRQVATEAHLEGNQQLGFDAAMFIAHERAHDDGDDAFARFLYDRFPPRLKRGTDAWLAAGGRTSRDAPPHPFAMTAYERETQQRALALGEQSEEAYATATAANRISDTYVLGTVVLATLMLLASLGPRLRHRNPRRAMLGLSGIGLLVVLVWLCTRPIAWIG